MLFRSNTAIVLEQMFPRTGPNYRELVGRFRVEIAGQDRGTTESMKRTFITRNNMQTTEAGIRSFGPSQVYVSLGEIQPDGQSVGVRMYTKPMILLIWIGSVIMALGGILSITDRRFRVAAPAKARKPARDGSSGGSAPQPAE